MPKGRNPNSLANLPKGKPYKKGEERARINGAKGRQKQIADEVERLDFVRALKAGLSTEGVSAKGNKLLHFVAVVNALINKAEHGDTRAIELVLKLLGQMPADKLEASQTLTIKDDWRQIAADLGISNGG